jgi:hypothetical protein
MQMTPIHLKFRMSMLFAAWFSDQPYMRASADASSQTVILTPGATTIGESRTNRRSDL